MRLYGTGRGRFAELYMYCRNSKWRLHSAGMFFVDLGHIDIADGEVQLHPPESVPASTPPLLRSTQFPTTI